MRAKQITSEVAHFARLRSPYPRLLLTPHPLEPKTAPATSTSRGEGQDTHLRNLYVPNVPSTGLYTVLL